MSAQPPAEVETQHPRRPAELSQLTLVVGVLAVYGLGLGVPGLLVGAFTNVEVLIGAALHGLGGAFAVVALANLKVHSRSAIPWTLAACTTFGLLHGSMLIACLIDSEDWGVALLLVPLLGLSVAGLWLALRRQTRDLLS